MTETGRIKRGLLAHYLKAGTANVRIGKDLEEFLVTMNPEVVTVKNILDETSSIMKGYTKQSTVAPFYAEYGDPLFDWLQSIIDGDKKLTEVETKAYEVRLWDGAIVGAVEETVIVAVTSYGGNQDGYRIEFDLHYKGDGVKGTWDPSTKTFTKLGA